MLQRLTALLFIGLVIAGCSLYQSEGRDFLEKNAFEFAASGAQSNLLGCRYGRTNESSWILIQESKAARVLASEEDGYQMRVIPKINTMDFHCDYRFSSAQEIYEKSNAAIELTLLHFGLGEFAFRPMTHLK